MQPIQDESTWTPQQRTPPFGENTYVTYEAFLDWADEDTHAEWVDGKVIMASPVSLRHQDIVNFLLDILSTYVRIHALGKVADGPFQMKLATSGREPDLLFVTTEHVDRLQSTYLNGPADLVVEVVPPESVSRDWTTKFAEYQKAGIPEYWVIDSVRNDAAFYQLNEAGQYQRIAPDANGVYTSRIVPGFWLRVAWLWQDSLPQTVPTLLEIDRDTYAEYLRNELRQARL
ncbi:MAG TPA: Uma2 family endonuclease [Ktedonobacterales bacterium]|nr:Uma2 family endonuclease [Ktedonobacterales bacterium]